MRLLIAATACALAIAGGAAAQDYNADPNYGDITLSPGFTPDPHLVSLRAGGDISATAAGSGCSGYITSAPDFRLVWDGKGSLNLKISVLSKADTTLVVNGPNGEWYCDDDTGEDNNPLITLSSIAGRYEIWVGTYSSGDPAPAVLSVSEIANF
ncbi:MAG: peptidase S1 [Brevundimonas sp.]|nr:MAG: peptidase S1 [Brevundimonas sp.]